jgi:hypothetical protein
MMEEEKDDVVKEGYYGKVFFLSWGRIIILTMRKLRMMKNYLKSWSRIYLFSNNMFISNIRKNVSLTLNMQQKRNH